VCAVSGLEDPRERTYGPRLSPWERSTGLSWTGDCHLLLAVFFNAPKVRRAILDSATIVPQGGVPVV